jgi:hypothetical protein
MIHLLGPRAKAPENALVINTTSRSNTWSKGLSPFFLGPIPLYDGTYALNMENAWQYAKVYAMHEENGEPTAEYFAWARAGWNKNYADRYPMGKGAKPLYSWWGGKKLSYVEARKAIYAPLYAQAVEKTPAYKTLVETYKQHGEIWLWDFDAYDHHKLNMTYTDVVNNEKRKMGHAFVLAMMLDNDRAWEKS